MIGVGVDTAGSSTGAVAGNEDVGAGSTGDGSQVGPACGVGVTASVTFERSSAKAADPSPDVGELTATALAATLGTLVATVAVVIVLLRIRSHQTVRGIVYLVELLDGHHVLAHPHAHVQQLWIACHDRPA